MEKISQPPIQHDLIVQSPVNENKGQINDTKGQMNDNKDLSSVQKRQVTTSQSVDTAHSDKTIEARVEDNKNQMEIIKGQIDVNNDLSSVQKRQIIPSKSVESTQIEESINKGNIVDDHSNISDPVSPKKPSKKLRVKTAKKRVPKWKRKVKTEVDNTGDVTKNAGNDKEGNNVLAKGTIKCMDTIENVGNDKKGNNVLAKGTIKCILTLIKCIQALIKGSPGILWGIVFLLAFQAALSLAAPTNGTNTQTSLTTLLSSQAHLSSCIRWTQWNQPPTCSK